MVGLIVHIARRGFALGHRRCLIPDPQAHGLQTARGTGVPFDRLTDFGQRLVLHEGEEPVDCNVRQRGLLRDIDDIRLQKSLRSTMNLFHGGAENGDVGENKKS